MGHWNLPHPMTFGFLLASVNINIYTEIGDGTLTEQLGLIKHLRWKRS